MEAMKIANALKGMDASGVDVGDDQEEPTIGIDSPEEKAALAEMDALLPDELKNNEARLMCLRARKYDVSRAAALLPKFVTLQKDFEFGEFGKPDAAQLTSDIASGKFIVTGQKDEKGRMICLVRLRFHRPKESKAPDMIRLIGTSMLYALRDPAVQQRGICILQDVTDIGVHNVDPNIPRLLFTRVFPCMPIRLGRLVIFNPPWFLSKIVFPVVSTFFPKKIKERMYKIDGRDTAKLHKYLPKTSLFEEYGGSAGPIDVDAWVKAMS